MNNPVIIPITGSSQIVGAAYDLATHTMFVQFTGGSIYEYAGVPNDVADAFNAADSKGKAFGALIRGKYPTTKQPAPEAADTET